MELTSGDLGIKTEWRDAFWWEQNTAVRGNSKALADLALHLCAKLLESEFRQEHKPNFQGACYGCGFMYDGAPDPRHSYDWPAWIDKAKGVLGG